MIKYFIHACLQRMWYVEEFLIPSMKAQGIDESQIKVKCDKNKLGNLVKCMEIFERMRGDGGAWHLQDDVIICRDFKQRTEENSSGLVCGYCWDKDDGDQAGLVTAENMWYSFPCIHIPNEIAQECAKWFFSYAQQSPRYASWVAARQYDDYFFNEFIRENYPNEQILQLKPCLVDHVDYLIGGTTLKKVRRDEQTRAKWFDDLDLVDELAEKLKERGNG